MKPLLKYTGGKSSEFKYVEERLPEFEKYFEPFCGGAAVFFALDTESKECYLNDISKDLINFYNNVPSSEKTNEMIALLKIYDAYWQSISRLVDNNHRWCIDVFNGTSDIKYKLEEQFPERIIVILEKSLKGKIKRIKNLIDAGGSFSEEDIFNHVECGLKTDYYTYVREIYNGKIQENVFDATRAAAFYFIREFCYSSMSRFNSRGLFNVPYGGISYNRKDFATKITNLESSGVQNKLNKKHVKIDNMDFEDFLKSFAPDNNSFIFLDPPYDTEFSDYDNNEFGPNEQKRLASYLIDECEVKWLMIIKKTDFISSLYPAGTECKYGKLSVETFDKKYMVSFRERNNRDCEHLIIKNYE